MGPRNHRYTRVLGYHFFSLFTSNEKTNTHGSRGIQTDQHPAILRTCLSRILSVLVMSDYYGESSSGGYLSEPHFKRSASIRSEGQLDLQGPLEIVGSVKSGRGIKFEGDFVIRDKLDAYGSIEINGNLSCDGRMKAYGNILLNGYLLAKDKIKGYGKLQILGSVEGTEIRIYGNLVINGYLKCRRLIVYGSLTLIGPESSYVVEESEEITGPKLMREEEPDWDWGTAG
ncbi:hypothetical protein B0I35DRAFT_417748 [Stachybotrys elegans]|uniref:Uncharacterized protein n=1 Tax=Stachybotrys elegans TaxID=80388 RepID=A0A8K0T129_9HYPO|nr:hypothetical protein B0I35DRAFT_417748 [Stachybotrys elegans]